jgi:hypothetical protein
VAGIEGEGAEIRPFAGKQSFHLENKWPELLPVKKRGQSSAMLK